MATAAVFTISQLYNLFSLKNVLYNAIRYQTAYVEHSLGIPMVGISLMRVVNAFAIDQLGYLILAGGNGINVLNCSGKSLLS